MYTLPLRETSYKGIKYRMGKIVKLLYVNYNVVRDVELFTKQKLRARLHETRSELKPV